MSNISGKRSVKLRIGAIIRNLLLVALLLGQVGCASTKDDSADGTSTATDSDQPKHDDSNGWGTGFGMGH